jgi:hypothetical protein
VIGIARRGLVAGIAAILIGSCSPTPPVGATTIVDAARATVATGSAHIDFRMELTASSESDGSRTVNAAADTEFGAERRAVVTFDLTSVGAGVMEARVDGPDVYLRGDVLARFTGGATRWLYFDRDNVSPATRQLAATLSGPNDASLLLYYLLGADGPIEELGTEIIDGTDTTGYGLSISLDAALEVIEPALRDALQLNMIEMRANGIDPQFSGEAWLDGQNLVRRVRYELALSSVSGGGGMTLTADLSAFGEPVTVEVPDPSEVTNAEDVLE